VSKADVRPDLDWREIASRVAAETNRDNALKLAKELIRALDDNSNRRLEQVTAESKMRDQGAA
jgi:hypothetical protein